MAVLKYTAWFRKFRRDNYTRKFKVTHWVCVAHGLASEHVARRALDCELGAGTGLVLPDGEKPVVNCLS